MTKARDLAQAPNQTPAFKNRIINGAFLIWQRGTSFTPSSVIYGADRFASYKAGASAGDYARSTDVPSGSGFTYSGYFNNADIRHPVELPVVGNAGEYVSGSTWTVSFWAKVASGSASSAVGLGFADGSGAGNFGRWGSDQSFNLTTTWQFFSRTFTVSNSPVGSNACVLLYFGATAGLHITGVQLEKGSTATSFDYRPYGTELALCQRYFYRISGAAEEAYAGSGWSDSTTSCITIATFPVTMRAKPTFSTSGTASDYNIRQAAAVVQACTAVPNASDSTTNIARINAAATGLTTGYGAAVRNATTNGFFAFSAEL